MGAAMEEGLDAAMGAAMDEANIEGMDAAIVDGFGCGRFLTDARAN